MNPYLMLADIVAITLLMLVFYVPRKGRRELVSSFLVTNVGVLALATAMSVGTIAAGLGLGLFGVLSIIRLRSEELSHREIAYYFAALSLGLLGGLEGLPLLWSIGLMALVLLAIAIGDHPRVTAHTRSAELIIDQAITHPAALERRTSELLGGVVTDLVIRRVDLINDSTTVQVRYRLLTTNDTTAGNQLDKPNTYQGPFEPAMRATGNREPLR